MVKITREVDAYQYVVGQPLPPDCHECQFEVNWSVGRSFVYFTYAKCNVKHWMSVQKWTEVPTGDNDSGLSSWAGIETADGEKYFRKVLPFAFWSVKSEASVSRNHSAVYATEEEAQLVYDYAALEKWTKSQREGWIEHRTVNGSYGRGFIPLYLKPTDWLVKDDVPYGHDNLGSRTVWHVVSDEDMQKLRTS